MSSSIQVFNDFVLALGFGVVLLEIGIAFYFWRLKAPFARALAVMCLAESAAALSTVIFAMTSVMGVYGALHPVVVISLRMVIFGGLTISSLYLMWRVKKS